MSGDVSVIKVGGSLLDWPGLPHQLSVFLNGHRARVANGRLLLIAGGGPAVDLVRRLDRDHHLGNETAHRLAIHAMDLTARFLAAILPGAVTVDRLEERFSAWSADRIPVLVPSRILQDIEQTGIARLPRTWDLTSDSIAAWIAGYLGAESLILLKSASLPRGADREMAVDLERVDPLFPRIAFFLARVEYLNLRDPDGELLTLPPCLERARKLDDPLCFGQNSGCGDLARANNTSGETRPGGAMSLPRLLPLDQHQVSPLTISTRLRGQLVYFMTPPGSAGVPALGENEYWIARGEVIHWLAEGVFYLVSPLDSANATEVELTEEQESLLTWLDKHGIQHVRLVE